MVASRSRPGCLRPRRSIFRLVHLRLQSTENRHKLMVGLHLAAPFEFGEQRLTGKSSPITVMTRRRPVGFRTFNFIPMASGSLVLNAMAKSNFGTVKSAKDIGLLGQLADIAISRDLRRTISCLSTKLRGLCIFST